MEDNERILQWAGWKKGWMDYTNVEIWTAPGEEPPEKIRLGEMYDFRQPDLNMNFYRTYVWTRLIELGYVVYLTIESNWCIVEIALLEDNGGLVIEDYVGRADTPEEAMKAALLQLIGGEVNEKTK